MAGDYSYLLTLRAGPDDDLISFVTNLPYGTRRTLIVAALRHYIFNSTSLDDIMEELTFVEAAIKSLQVKVIDAGGVQIASVEESVDVEDALKHALMEFGS